MISINKVEQRLQIKHNAAAILEVLQEERKREGRLKPCSIEKQCIKQIEKDRVEAARLKRRSFRIECSDEDD